MKATTIGIDLAKNVIQVHGVDERGDTIVRKQLKRDQVLQFFGNLTACRIGMEACGSAHYWARKLEKLGHIVKLMAPQFVKPYVKSNKNDMADAEAICEAVSRPNMRFVAVKNGEQQSVLALHRARQGFVKARTAQANQIRGLLSGLPRMAASEYRGQGLHKMHHLPAECHRQLGRLTHQIRIAIDSEPAILDSIILADKKLSLLKIGNPSFAIEHLYVPMFVQTNHQSVLNFGCDRHEYRDVSPYRVIVSAN